MGEKCQDSGDNHYECGDPKVETVSAYRDGSDLILVLDGVENRLPGGYIHAGINEDNEVTVSVHATFRAEVIDLSVTEPGS